jgi:Flp pilus assembly protein TadG
MKAFFKLRRFRRDEKGAAALEFALAVPVLVTFIVGIVQVGVLFMANAGLSHAVGEAARFATIFPRPTAAQIEARVAASDYGLDPAELTISPVAYGTTGGINYADIEARYEVTLDFIFFSLPPVTLIETRRAFIQ